MTFFKVAKEVQYYLAYFYYKLFHLDIPKIAQSGHTDCCKGEQGGAMSHSLPGAVYLVEGDEDCVGLSHGPKLLAVVFMINPIKLFAAHA